MRITACIWLITALLWGAPVDVRAAGFFEKIEEGVGKIGDAVEEVAKDVKESVLGNNDSSSENGGADPASPPGAQQPDSTPTLNHNSAKVAQAQSLLRALGYDAGKVDGIYGPYTEQAIRAFEQGVGLPPSGNVTSELLDRLQLAAGVDGPTPSNTSGNIQVAGASTQDDETTAGQPKSATSHAAKVVGETDGMFDSVLPPVDRGADSPPPEVDRTTVPAGAEAGPELPAGSCAVSAFHNVRNFAGAQARLAALLDACGTGGRAEGRYALQSIVAPLIPAQADEAEAIYEEKYSLSTKIHANAHCGSSPYANDLAKAQKHSDTTKNMAAEAIYRQCSDPNLQTVDNKTVNQQSVLPPGHELLSSHRLPSTESLRDRVGSS